jgi:isoleucyl-tRNA synthetase
MYHLAEALARWLAPILSFTSEEIWRHLPGSRGESVFLETWYEGLYPLDAGTPYDNAFWDRILGIREQISKSLEGLRSSEAIGSSLDAEVTMKVNPSVYALLKPVENDLRFIFINSETTVVEDASLEGDDIRIEAKASEAAKCVRCWQHREDVGSHPDHPEICGRCAENVAGGGEIRVLG